MFNKSYSIFTQCKYDEYPIYLLLCDTRIKILIISVMLQMKFWVDLILFISRDFN